eukprot:CAMPEP_0204904246 /NCGR_PEP_ID=MMETSP1397-20131031/4756_1 /ASSEMBLY_ACC=CAM_ASM_000891 /TAXON_ID=49980 /ORGANISM="Climacostomum Climacostomum virens, Strain Stock W-24" /LENGTH=245 /DNA_ID=CAMNT_0052073013 /DNA_START=576 /DNA_END=1310 /DNA_ORIENTATION=+
MDDLRLLVTKAMGPQKDQQATLELRQRLQANPSLKAEVQEFVETHSELQWTLAEFESFESSELQSTASLKAVVALALTLNSPLQRLRRGVFDRLSVSKDAKAAEVLAKTTVRVLTKSSLSAGFNSLRDNNYLKLKELVRSLDQQVKRLEDRLIEQLQRISVERPPIPERNFDSQELTGSSGGSQDDETALKIKTIRKLVFTTSANLEQCALWKWQMVVEQIKEKEILKQKKFKRVIKIMRLAKLN